MIVWVHIVIFMLTAGIMVLDKAGWIRLEALGDRKSIRMFFLVAVCGNLLGMAVTAGSGSGTVYPEGHKIPKEETGLYEQEYRVTVDGEETETVQVQVPEKETEEEMDVSGTAGQEEALDPEAERKQELAAMLEEYNQEKQDPDYYYLPSEWDGKHLEWERPGDSSGTLLAAMGLLAAFAVLVRKAKEQQAAEAKRMEQLLMDYPGLILKFTLLIQAGMTARSAFRKMAGDYRRRQPKGGRFAYEAITAACYEMDSGVAELEAYRHFGERCGQMKYKTFSTLLIQNLQKGSRRMAELLEREALEAWDERKRKARVLGEAAATKLLVPMVMMLAVVMAIIMIPAFLSFYG